MKVNLGDDFEYETFELERARDIQNQLSEGVQLPLWLGRDG